MTASVTSRKNKKAKIRWICPHCGRFHKWIWDAEDAIPNVKIDLQCDRCGQYSEDRLIWDR